MSNTQKTLLERIQAMPTPSDYPLIAAILAEAAAEIKRLQAEVDRLTKVVDQAICIGGIRIPYGLLWTPGYDGDDICAPPSRYPELRAELKSREAMQAAIDYAEGEA